LKEVAEDKLILNKVKIYSSGRVEIIVVKEEIAQLEQFLLIPQ